MRIKALGGRFGGIFSFNKPILIVTDLDFLLSVLTKDFDYFHDRDLYHNVKHDILSGNLVKVQGEYWKSLRRKLTPAFTSGKLRSMLTTILEVGSKFEQVLAESVQKNEAIDVHDILSRFTCDIIGSCAFGIECNSMEIEDSEFLKMGLKSFQPSTSNSYRAVKFISTHFPRLSKHLGLKTTRPEIEEFFTKLVKTVIDHREAHNVKRQDFIDLLMNIDNEDNHLSDGRDDRPGKLSLGQIAAQSFIFFIAVSFLIFCLFILVFRSFCVV